MSVDGLQPTIFQRARENDFVGSRFDESATEEIEDELRRGVDSGETLNRADGVEEFCLLDFPATLQGVGG